MIPKPASCVDCSIYGDGQGFIQLEGTGSVPLMIVGESAGFHERRDGLPFRPNAQIGSVLHKTIQRLRLNRSQFTISNLIHCQPPGNYLANTSYEYGAINSCREHLDREVATYKPKVILACGNLVFKHLSGLTGRKLDAHSVRGYVFRSSRFPEVLLVPTYHPGFIRRGNLALQELFMKDFLKAMWIAQGKEVPFSLEPESDPAFKYNLNPTLEDKKEFLFYLMSHPEIEIAFDIENPKQEEDEEEREIEDNTITMVQFSISEGTGIAFKYTEENIPIIRAILALPNIKISHNGEDYDKRVLSNHGIQVEGEHFDCQWMAHCLNPDLPIGLQAVSSWFNFPFAWKHLSGSSFEFYGVADADSARRNYFHLRAALEKRKMWDGFYRLNHQLMPVLRKIEARGLPINREKQLAFANEIEVLDEDEKLVGGRKFEIRQELKKYIPESFEKLNKVEGYKRVPKEVKQAQLDYVLEVGDSFALAPEEYITEKTGFILRDFVTGEELSPIEQALIKAGAILPGKEAGVEKRWVKRVEFNPSSVDDVSNYIKLRGHEEWARKLMVTIKKEYGEELQGVDGNGKGKDNLPTGAVLLQKLALKTQDKGYALLVEDKKLTKMKGTYLNNKYIPGADGRVHTRFTLRPASWQLSSRRPNVQNYPIHSSLAKKFKECIQAKDGHKLLKVDYRGYHNKMMGFLSLDQVYLRVAGLDTHSFVTGYVFNYPGMDACLRLSDKDLGEFLEEIKKKYKKVRDDQIKHVVHGINFGLSEEGCYKRYMEEFNPKLDELLKLRRNGAKQLDDEAAAKLIEGAGRKKVKQIYEIVRGLFPKVFKWQQETIIRADKEGYIQTPYGARRWFFSATEPVYNKFGNVERVKKGEQAEEALAFPVSNNAHCHMRESMLLLEEAGFNEKYRLINTIHDALIYEPLAGEVDNALADIVPIMERKSTILKNELMPFGFFCEVDGEVGINMAEMEAIK